MMKTPITRELLRSGAISRLVARGAPGGFVLAMYIGVEERVLSAQRGGPRLFKHLDTLASYAQKLGFSVLEVDLSTINNTALV